jgi:DNA-binding IclR family transcriptional regulator
VTEVAAALGLPKSGAHSLLSTLASEGLLQRTPGNRYRLGWSLFEHSQTLLETTDFLCIARRMMEQLVAGWGETTHLAVLVDGQVLYVEKLQGDRALEIVLSRVGKRLPAHCSGVGKVLLAHRPWDWRSSSVRACPPSLRTPSPPSIACVSSWRRFACRASPTIRKRS